jgi:hypothetical protein
MRTGVVLLAGMACLSHAAAAGERVDREKVAGLFKMFLRDSAELPMDVSATTVVTDAKGRETRRKHTVAHLLFKGYNERSGNFAATLHGNFFQMRTLYDSMAPVFALFKAFSLAVPGQDGPPKLEMAEQGTGVVVHAAQSDCGAFRMLGELIAKDDCSAVEFQIGRDAAGGLTIERFRMDARNLPAAANLRYLGPCEVRRYYTEGDVQKGYLTGDPQPFLVPKRVVTTIETDKGRIVVTNEHTMGKKR